MIKYIRRTSNIQNNVHAASRTGAVARLLGARLFKEKNMKNKIIALVVLVATLALMLSSCGHSHSFNVESTADEYLAAAADCENAAKYYYSCSCGEKGEETFAHGEPNGHKPAKAVSEKVVLAGQCKDGKHDEVVYCSVCNKELSRVTHVDFANHGEIVNGACVDCKAAVYTLKDDYIEFGEYPQTLKKSNVTVGNIPDYRGYFLGSDGAYYAKVVSTPANVGYTFSTGDVVNGGTEYFFKVEPIRWRILTKVDGKALILCDGIIENSIYDEESNKYIDSDLRAWLNEQFFENAFTPLQQSFISATVVDNSAASTGKEDNTNATENTVDNVFLLSYSDVTNAEYGFSANALEYDVARQMIVSDYARASGTWINMGSSNVGNGYWWLRSPVSENETDVINVDHGGYTNYDYKAVGKGNGVVPALWIML